ncbi:MAG TPA: hypothetical protein VI729_02390, partial [Anaerolineales bacterium]|nr:hypothetical protein [Anaerolineales bacterium]
MQQEIVFGQTLTKGHSGQSSLFTLVSLSPRASRVKLQSSHSLRRGQVAAQNFAGLVPINVVVTPQNGPRQVFPAEINMANGKSSRR